jgi:hypothetical protein
MRNVGLGVVGVVACISLACSTKSASEYATSEFYTDMTVTATGDGKSTVMVTFREEAASLTFLQLTADDTLEATQGTAAAKKLTETSLLGYVGYSTSFDVEAADSEFVVSLTREKDSGAPNSRIQLPVPFTVTPLSNTAGFSRVSDAVTLEWDNTVSATISTDSQQLTITGECIKTHNVDLTSDALSHTVAANTLKKRDASGNETVADECTATATVSRSRTGTLDSAYKGGSARGLQTRGITFKSKA